MSKITTGTPVERTCSMTSAGPALVLPITTDGLIARMPSALSIR